MEYTKEWLPLDGQVDRLIARGLDVEDRASAIATLEAVGYYRLADGLLRDEPLCEDLARSEHVVSQLDHAIFESLLVLQFQI